MRRFHRETNGAGSIRLTLVYAWKTKKLKLVVGEWKQICLLRHVPRRAKELVAEKNRYLPTLRTYSGKMIMSFPTDGREHHCLL